jgi:hypothetical protein
MALMLPQVERRQEEGARGGTCGGRVFAAAPAMLLGRSLLARPDTKLGQSHCRGDLGLGMAAAPDHSLQACVVR